MLYQHLLDLKKVCIAIHPLPLVDSLYTCQDVDNCERPLSQFICRKPSIDTWWPIGAVSTSNMSVVDQLDLKISDYIQSKAI